MGAGAREPRRAGESWGAALSQVVEFPISRWPEVREATLAPAVAARRYRGLARRRQSASEGERKSVARGMRGLRARWGRRSGGLRRGGLVHGARGLGCAPSPARALRCPQVRGRVGQGALDLVQGMEQGSLGSSAGRWRAGSLE